MRAQQIIHCQLFTQLFAVFKPRKSNGSTSSRHFTGLLYLAWVQYLIRSTMSSSIMAQFMTLSAGWFSRWPFLCICTGGWALHGQCSCSELQEHSSHTFLRSRIPMATYPRQTEQGGIRKLMSGWQAKLRSQCHGEATLRHSCWVASTCRLSIILPQLLHRQSITSSRPTYGVFVASTESGTRLSHLSSMQLGNCTCSSGRWENESSRILHFVC